MAATDRIEGLNIGVAVKPACYVTSTAELTLSGAQTVDGVAVGNSERVLVQNQSNGVYNGIWLADSSTWVRAKDCDGSKDLIPGSVVYVDRGSAYGQSMWVFNSSSTATSLVVGTDSITLSRMTQALTGVSSWVSSNFLSVTSSTAALEAIGAVASSAATISTSTNTFTVPQAFSTSAYFGGDITITSTDTSTGADPDLVLYRNSTSAAANDQLGRVIFEGNTDGTAIRSTMASIHANLIDPSSGSLDTTLTLRTRIGDTLADRFHIGGGMYTDDSSGGDLGQGSINMPSTGGFYRNSRLVGEWLYRTTVQPSTTDYSVVLASGISSSSSCREIEVIFNNVARNGGDTILLMLRTSTETQSTGPGSSYFSNSMRAVSGGANTTFLSIGAAVYSNNWSDNVRGFGKATFVRFSSTSHLWTFTGSFGSTTDDFISIAGSKTLAGEIDAIDVTTTSTTVVFSTGEFMVRYR